MVTQATAWPALRASPHVEFCAGRQLKLRRALRGHTRIVRVSGDNKDQQAAYSGNESSSIDSDYARNIGAAIHYSILVVLFSSLVYELLYTPIFWHMIILMKMLTLVVKHDVVQVGSSSFRQKGFAT